MPWASLCLGSVLGCGKWRKYGAERELPPITEIIVGRSYANRSRDHDTLLGAQPVACPMKTEAETRQRTLMERDAARQSNLTGAGPSPTFRRCGCTGEENEPPKDQRRTANGAR